MINLMKIRHLLINILPLCACWIFSSCTNSNATQSDTENVITVYDSEISEDDNQQIQNKTKYISDTIFAGVDSSAPKISTRTTDEVEQEAVMGFTFLSLSDCINFKSLEEKGSLDYYTNRVIDFLLYNMWSDLAESGSEYFAKLILTNDSFFERLCSNILKRTPTKQREIVTTSLEYLFFYLEMQAEEGKVGIDVEQLQKFKTIAIKKVTNKPINTLIETRQFFKELIETK